MYTYNKLKSNQVQKAEKYKHPDNGLGGPVLLNCVLLTQPIRISLPFLGNSKHQSKLMVDNHYDPLFNYSLGLKMIFVL